ncbi:PIN domain-containing protein [Bradyrhizobium sp. BWC-3-1]|uniref:PIN domain-containing protein n=1 Tax=Bradyrhizobium sp. BWC-3-1 TaxID=3080012 RepID=UPI00293E01B0|nr:PIN domain-containing protein [Bradyrhizobium sp. BWC-3-1]WOH60926.1 PIN domain-containing protein [Bradyrhizobium sp. BWC-3-1]
MSALEELVRMNFISLIVPKIVVDELARNKERVIEESGRSIASTLRRAKEMLARYGKDGDRQIAITQLTEIDQKSVNYRDAATKAVERIERLIFGASEIVEIVPSMKLAAAERALHSRAPFHRQRNSMGDAILIEAYGQIQQRSAGHYAFITHNIKDFSNVGVNEQEPHPDIVKFFPKSRSRYFTKLGNALNVYRPLEFQDIIVEHTLDFPPRRFVEITEAIGKLIDQVWYNRHQVWNEKLQRGEAVLIEDREERGRDPFGLRINRGVWEMAERAARSKESKYGADELGPWDDFEWGMINGKLSALRWVLGEDWDMLDT